MALYKCTTKCWHNGKMYRPGDVVTFSDELYPVKSAKEDKDGNVIDPGGGITHFIEVDNGVAREDNIPVPPGRAKVKVNNKTIVS